MDHTSKLPSVDDDRISMGSIGLKVIDYDQTKVNPKRMTEKKKFNKVNNSN